MNYTGYVSGISFRYIKPYTPMIPIPWDRLRYWKKVGTSLEFMNTKIPEHEHIMKYNLQEICYMPRMSTFAIAAMINRGVSQMSDAHVFVNVGVWHGFSFLSGIIHNEAKTCIGIDNFSEFGGPRNSFLKRFNTYKSSNHHFYEMDYHAYLSRIHKDPIGFYIYDGDHSYENQLMGLQQAEPFFAHGCIILIDDSNYEHVRQATLDFIARSPYAYRIILDRTTCCNYHLTLWNGVMILQRV
jgi:cephalosporin hydroxylase